MARYAFTAALSKLADDDGGVVTRKRLLSLDFSDDDIADGLSRDLLVRVLPGVYLIGRRTLEPLQLRVAATLHAAPSMLSGRYAAEHRGLITQRPGVVKVMTTRRERKPRALTETSMADGKSGLILVGHTPDLDAESIAGVPTAVVPRMLVDIASTENHSMLLRVWKQADFRGILDLTAVEHALRTKRRAGNPLVRELFRKHPGRFGVPGYFESASEVDFRQLVHDAGLSDPEINVPMRLAGQRYVADFLWRLIGLVVEVDDPSHDRPLARQSDSMRDAAFIEAGLTVVRFTTDRLRAEPARCMTQLAAIIDRLARAPAA
ncbi:MAG: DUF559 domain-containing protein [Solirubrobacteraceae bacterium]|nr:DUF559 domain-containing protein [Solirubrobacteraceae bacterium]